MIVTHPVWLVIVDMNGDHVPKGRWDANWRSELSNPSGVHYRLEINAPTAADALTVAGIAHGGHGQVVEIYVAPPCTGACRGVPGKYIEHGGGCGCGRCNEYSCITCDGKGFI